jgi:pSer/pThr/pTyr-binding forkhead associated (FHA) protein
MVDVVLLFGRILLLALLYLFLFAAVRAGVGLVRAGSPAQAPRPLGLVVTAGPPELKGIKVALDRAVRIGREPGFELVIADDFVSTRHAQVVPGASGPVLEDLGSTNGTLLNRTPVRTPTVLKAGDEIALGAVKLTVARL